MSANSTDVARPSAAEAGDLNGNVSGQTTHSSAQERRHLIVLALMMVLLASIYPLLAKSSYKGSADLHATIEMAGALFGLVAGFALIVRFYTLGDRFHLFVGLAFFVNGAEDLIHGLLSFRYLQQWTGLPASSLEQFIPGTYVTGRLLIGVILLLAPFMTRWLGESLNPKRETKWTSLTVLLITMVVTTLAFQLPLPRFIYADRPISRPVDFLSAIVLLVAMIVFLLEYHRGRDMLTWWILLSIAVNTVGQVMMSFSKSLYDPFFDIAHVHKVFGYMIPLLGFSLYQIAIITERQRAGEEIRKLSQFLNSVIDNANVWVDVLDEKANVVIWNKAAEGISGYSREEVVGHDKIWEWLYPDEEYCNEVHAEAVAIIEKGGGEEDAETTIRRKDGQTRIISWHSQQLVDAKGNPIGSVAFGRDVSERKRMEEALRESEERFRTIVETAPSLLLITDAQGNNVYVSPNCEEITGYTQEELQGRVVWWVHEDDTPRAKEVYDRTFREGVGYRDLEYKAVKKNGELWYGSSSWEPFEDAEGELQGVVFQTTDITERKRAEEQLQRYAAELEQRNEEVKWFAYIVSHDLRAPLTNLKGFTEELGYALEVIGSAMETALPHLEEKQQQAVTIALQEDVPEALGFINSSVTRMDHFINAVLKLSRLGRRELKFEPVDMEAIVQVALETLAHQIEERQVKVTVGPLPEVVADRASMEQIVGNLLGNAVKYLDPDRPGEIEITGERDRDETTLCVRDNGRGIAEEDMDKVFAPFRRAGRQDVLGEGMGLPYVQTLVRRHGGRIWCESEPGVGTTFTFTLSNHFAEEGS